MSMGIFSDTMTKDQAEKLKKKLDKLGHTTEEIFSVIDLKQMTEEGRKTAPNRDIWQFAVIADLEGCETQDDFLAKIKTYNKLLNK